MGWTNLPEVGAFIVSQALRIGGQYAFSTLALVPLYRRIAAAGGALWIMPIAIAGSALIIAAAFPVFLGLRALFGAVPDIVAARGAERKFVTSGAEVGAYALGGVIVMVLAAVVNYAFMVHIFMALQSAGMAYVFVAVSLALSSLYALVFLGLFVALRRGFYGARQ
jgi:hypothetical protein